MTSHCARCFDRRILTVKNASTHSPSEEENVAKMNTDWQCVVPLLFILCAEPRSEKEEREMRADVCLCVYAL